jgi:hypothetical protein
MSTVTVTPEQARYLAALLQQAQRAHSTYAEAVALLTLGHAPTGATVAQIDTDTGTLTLGDADAAD